MNVQFQTQENNYIMHGFLLSNIECKLSLTETNLTKIILK